MNTMADGAAQRLVAQIGEALFGQPGLTLMELAEKVKASQPSKAGQGNVETFYVCEKCNYHYHDVAVSECDCEPGASRFRKVELFASSHTDRQPVGENEKDYVEFLDRQNDSLRRAIHAIMAKLVFLLDEDQFADVDAIALAAGVSPPAQAVDLGQFRMHLDRSKRYLSTCTDNAEGKLIAREIADADRLMALIDSQAVGK